MTASSRDVVDVFDSGERDPRRRRLVLAAVVVLAVVAAGSLLLRQRAAEQVALAASLEVTTTANSPPGGAVRWLVTVRNDGARPVGVTSLAGGAGGIVLRSRGAPAGQVRPGEQVSIPVSVRLTCGGAQRPAGLAAELRVRRADGGTTARRVPLGAATPLLDVASTLCSVRPDLRDDELSGPVVPGQG